MAEQITLNMPRRHKAAALWAGDAGRRVTFAFALSALLVLRGRGAPTGRAVVAAAAVNVLAIFWALLGDPFAQLPFQASEGSGLALPQSLALVTALVPISIIAAALLPAACVSALEHDDLRGASVRLCGAWVAVTLALTLGAYILQSYGAQSWNGGSLLLLVGLWFITSGTLFLTPMRRLWWPPSAIVRRALVSTGIVATALVAAGIFGYVRGTAQAVSLGQGQATTVKDARAGEWTITQQGVSTFSDENREVVSATLSARQNGAELLLVPELSQFVDSQGEEVGPPIATTARRHGFLQSIRATLVGVAPGETSSVRIEFLMFQGWLWAGCAGLIACAAAACLSALRRT